MKILTVENVFFEGSNYKKGQTYDVDPRIAYALGSSVKITEQVKKPEVKTEDIQAPANTMMTPEKTKTTRRKRVKKIKV